MLIFSSLFMLWFANFATANELFKTTPEILKHRNISYEKHSVVTEDGYILSIFRVPKKERRGVVVLQHSLGLDSSMFLLSQKRSIAMEVYNAGYDLWLPNFRGLPLSKEHVNPNIGRLKYWDFSFHEIGYYDLSAILSHVNNVTGTKAIVINHSMACTASLVYAAMRPKEAQKNVKLFVNLASSAFMNHTQSPLKDFIGLQFSILKPIMEMLNLGAHFQLQPLVQIGKQLTLQLVPNYVSQSFTEFVLDFLLGKSQMGIDPEEFPMVVTLGTKATGVKIMYHYSQLIQSGRFCMYDYGAEENMRLYNSSKPPDYPLDAIRVPILLVISDTDTLSDAWGSNLLYEKLPEMAKIYGKMDIQNINHADYLIGKDRFIYFKKVLNFINSVK